MTANNQLVIIMEGPDGCGKTEIGKALSKMLDIPYFKVDSEHKHWRAGRFKEALEFDQTYITQFLKQTGHSVLIDRAYPSEYCYASVFNRETNDDVIAEVDEAFADMNTIVILCRRTWDGYKVVEDDLVENVGQLRDLDNMYERFKEYTNCNVVEIFVDSFNDDLTLQLPVLMKNIDMVRYRGIGRPVPMKVSAIE